MTPTELLKLSDIEFLKALVQRYPETAYLTGKAEASPEGNSLLKKDALAFTVFDSAIPVDPAAVEADRTFVGLLTLKWALTGGYDKFTSPQTDPASRLTRQSFDKLGAYAKRIAGTDADLELCLYSLACNDLGKTLLLVDKHKAITGTASEDHDQLLHALVIAAPGLFPAFQRLFTQEQQESYIRGIGANLNLGQFVQGENLPFNLLGMQALDAQCRELRLLCELFDFAGAAGHVNAGGSLVMTEDNYIAFSSAIEQLMTEPLDQSYQRYIAQRGKLAGIDTATPEGYAMARIAALSRAVTPDQGKVIQNAWVGLPGAQRQTLTDELTMTGLDGKKAILIYYAPAVIANAVKSAGSLADGLGHALPIFAKVYDDARRSHADQSGNGVITVNVAGHARQAA